MRRIAQTVASVLFALVFLVFCYKIVMRYAAHDSVAWADEVCVVLFIWVVFWANAFLVPDTAQIRFDLLYRAFGPIGQRWIAIFRAVLIGGLLAASLPGVIDYTLFLWRERTPVLGLRLDYVYACFGLFVAAVVVRAVCHIWHLLGRNWRQAL